MDRYKVKKIENKRNIDVSVPGSKSITNRALMLAAMSEGICILNGVLFSDDSRAFLDCLIKLGFEIDINESENRVVLKGEGGKIPNKTAEINVRSAGTAARFITVFLAVSGGHYVLESSEQMKKRPMKELLDNLEEKGVKIKYLESEGHFPFEIHSKGIGNVTTEIDTTTSSQYASALLMVSAVNGMKIKLKGSRVNGAYIKITLKMMEQFGICYEVLENTYLVQKQKFTLSNYNIEPDMSAACYFYAMAIILKTKALVRGIYKDSMQGDIKFLTVLEKLGCRLTYTDKGIEVNASFLDDFKGIEVDMSDFSDQALTMAVVAAFATSESNIKNIGHIRQQESDRVQVIVTELNKLGCDAYITYENGECNILIKPGRLHGAEIETYDDHRVAMSFAMAGLAINDVIIKNPMCCRKTFENYFDILDEITR